MGTLDKNWTIFKLEKTEHQLKVGLGQIRCISHVIIRREFTGDFHVWTCSASSESCSTNGQDIHPIRSVLVKTENANRDHSCVPESDIARGDTVVIQGFHQINWKWEIEVTETIGK